jgi:hypothetical protein
MIKKSLITLSAVAALATSSFAGGDSDIASQLASMQKEIASLKAQLSKNTKQIKKVDKLAKKAGKKANYAKMLANGDNLKWNVDFRTSMDKISYTMGDGTKKTNDALLTNRLWLNSAYAPSDNVAFYARLSYIKAYGAEVQNSQRSSGNQTFDWVANENAQGENTLNVKQAYWLYKNDTFLGTDVSWTASIGRRPATDGLLAHFREDQSAQSALAHTVNVEFDGASFRWNIENVTDLTGAWVKLCMGRGITNAMPRFTNTDYANDDSALHTDSNMVGLIFVPYDDGQYSVHTNWATSNNLIGYTTDGTHYLRKDNTYGVATADNPYIFKDYGDLDLATVAFVADGIGEEISDRLDATKAFISFAQSKTHPESGMAMLGSTDSKTGYSTWVGVQTPCPIDEDSKIGIEWNHGSKYWRSMTYGEDTMVGSKVAARGTAWEVYRHTKLTDSLTASIRYTKIDYDYSGSNGFFGNASEPVEITNQSNMVKKAEDIRAYIRYRY